MKKSGFFWHIHHDLLVEFCYDYDERVEYIDTWKLHSEVEHRLRVFQPVQGELPVEIQKTGQAYSEAYNTYIKADRACGEAYNTHIKKHQIPSKAHQAYVKACQIYGKTRQIYYIAHRTYVKALQVHKAEIEKLHAKECPDCSWNGEKLVFRGADYEQTGFKNKQK